MCHLHASATILAIIRNGYVSSLESRSTWSPEHKARRDASSRLPLPASQHWQMISNMPGNSLGNQVIRISIALGVLITVAVPLRLLARWKSKAKFAIDDVLIIMSILPQYVMIVLGVMGSLFNHCLNTR